MKLLYIWKIVHWRATSHQADETVCLAGVLGLDPKPLLEIPDEDYSHRIVKLLQLIRSIPLTLLFQPPPRLCEPGFRWAPTSFLNRFRETPSAPYRVVDGIGEVGPDGIGLSFSRPGIKLTADPNSAMLAMGEIFSLVVSVKDETQRFYVAYSTPNERAAKEVHGDGTIIQRPALIPLKPVAASLGGIAVLVDVFGEDDVTGCLNVTFIATVNVISRSAVRPLPLEGLSLLCGEFSFKEQRWLVH